jgi:hypothetical protein
MTAQIIPFPARVTHFDPVIEDFYQYALGQFPDLRNLDSEVEKLMAPCSMWIAWDRWSRRAGLSDIEQPDCEVLVERIIKHNNSL